MEYNKPTLAFVDHSFHKKSHSGDFLRELFSDNFQVIDYWDDSWKGGKQIEAEELNKYDYVYYFQLINSLSELKKIKSKIIWSPMYDGLSFDDHYWRMLATFPIKILCFSQKVHDQCLKYGIQTILVQYYYEPVKNMSVSSKEGNHFFFWYRGLITFKDIKKIIKPGDVSSFIYKSTPDPFTKKEIISEKDIADYKIRIIESDFLPKNEYLDLLSECNFYIAPRRKEGIGMSFLEAMSMGHVVIGSNEATMNEYIQNNFNGYLFDKDTKFINFKNSKEVRKNSILSAKCGHENWKNDKLKIINFFLSPFIAKRRGRSLLHHLDYLLYLLRMKKNKISTKLHLFIQNI